MTQQTTGHLSAASFLFAHPLIGQVKNASSVKYNVPLMAGSNFSAPYSVYSEYVTTNLPCAWG